MTSNFSKKGGIFNEMAAVCIILHVCLQETAVGFKEFTEAFHKYSSYLQKIFSYQSLRSALNFYKSDCIEIFTEKTFALV